MKAIVDAFVSTFKEASPQCEDQTINGPYWNKLPPLTAMPYAVIASVPKKASQGFSHDSFYGEAGTIQVSVFYTNAAALFDAMNNVCNVFDRKRLTLSNGQMTTGAFRDMPPQIETLGEQKNNQDVSRGVVYFDYAMTQQFGSVI